ncbi:MAG: hypothetical protein CME71_06445 [Halobacteriovorax sp.]|nr:hypothetical protein [Halobacteriovorax sp.]
MNRGVILALNFNDKDDDINAEINVTPLIDIMLVLLIVFMVTSSVSLESGLDVELPTASSTSGGDKPGAVIISLSAAGQISVAGKQVSKDQLESEIKNALTAGKTSLVILEGDKAADLGSAVTLMDIAKAAGATQFAIAAETSSN